MSVAAMQARKFYEQAVTGGRVFTFSAEGNLLVYPVGENEVVPFWSSRSRLLAIQKSHPKYRAYRLDETLLPEFCDEILITLEAQRVLVGVNWSGPRLTGYNLPVADLRRNLDYWIARQAGD
jgi:Protein of unknown function (DUF2750)